MTWSEIFMYKFKTKVTLTVKKKKKVSALGCFMYLYQDAVYFEGLLGDKTLHNGKRLHKGYLKSVGVFFADDATFFNN